MTRDKTEAVNTAIINGIAMAARLGLTKPHDVAISVRKALHSSGLHVVRMTRRLDEKQRRFSAGGNWLP